VFSEKAAKFSGMTFATFLSSLMYVFGHCISVQEIGTIFSPTASDLAITTPSSFSAVVRRKPKKLLAYY
jgi:hypothetical protein